MLQMKRATAQDRADIHRLWQAEFGDDSGFIDAFCARCGWDRILLLWEDGAARALTAIPQMSVALPDGTEGTVGYVYAHTTLKEHRGKGFGRMLLNYADFCLQNRGADGVVLVPAEESLFDYFARSGYQKGFVLSERTGDPAAEIPDGAALCPVTPEEYRTLREQCLKGRPHGVLPLSLLEQQKELCLGQGGDLYELKLPGGPGCAAAEKGEDGTVFLRELLVPKGLEDGAAGLLNRELEGARVRFRCPADGASDGTRPFGAVKWYRPEWSEAWQEEKDPYFGLALD